MHYCSTLEAAMLKEKIHNYMPYIGVALQVISNCKETFMWHFKKLYSLKYLLKKMKNNFKIRLFGT